MKRLITAASLACAVAWGAGLSAQTPPPTGEGAPSQQPLTVTGCVQELRDPSLIEGAIGGRTFVLTAVSFEQGAPAAGEVAEHQTIRMTADDEDQLAELVGKRVEVSGRLAEGDLAREPAGRTQGGDPAMGEVDPDDLPELEVRSIREVEGRCGVD